MSAAPSLLIGIGNADRGDDGAGLALVDALAGAERGQSTFSSKSTLSPFGEKSTLSPLEAVRCQGDLTQLFELWRGHDWVLVADMIKMADGVVGEVHRMDVSETGLPYTASCSSHGVSLAQSIEMARVLDCLPTRVEVLGIVGGSTALGAPLSEPVAEAVTALAAQLAQQFGCRGAAHA
jgi:hydrogenase maturation protease